MSSITIYPSRILADKQSITVAAHVTAPGLFERMPRSLWYRFPADHREYISERSDGQVVALFLVAMAHGLDLEVRSPLSARLWHGLNELQDILVRLMPTALKRIKIHAPELDSGLPSPLPHGVGSTFSGGADSFYTLWSHLAQNDPNPQTRLTHGLFIQGLDIRESENFDVCRVAYENLYQRLGLELLTATTNVRAWYPGMNWQLTFFAPVASPALVLGRLIGRFHAPTNSTIYDPPPLDELTLVDRYLSTETLEVDDDGVTISKADKLVALAPWDATYDLLRVCYTKIDGLQNCCRCRKCLLTMTTLEMAGTLSQYKTFRLPFTRAHLWGMRAGKSGPLIYDVRNKARELKRSDVVFDLNVALALNGVRWKLQRGRNTLQALRNPSLVQ